ncbi:sensor histidine kinase [Kutzneria sp. CA-103260]|uniref:sensor histidine kinase n=1 Tax=Kutzneria sp. CA-103260 TaxID=2802641 RepID=UPI001BABE962|nr:HAMP domain-containing sensor histidine kinase [Kutzneria sp. CA-103260]QUQ65810.1 HAMP domain-containing histidine kinase [Kutzneria sp. CA-103260]
MSLAERWRLGRRSVRVRLTALYSGLFIATGAVLLAITYVLTSSTAGVTVMIATPPPDGVPVSSLMTQQRDDVLSGLLVESAVALGIMAVVSLLLGWVVAGRVLRPLRTMSHRVRHLSEDNLHERLAVAGPPDELKDLADTFDGLLARLETAFEAQRLFVANASHELRTPLTLERTLIEVSLADPDPTVESLQDTHRRLLANNQHQERLIEALLMLARSQRGIGARRPVDLAVLAKEATATKGELRVDTTLAPATVAGDPHLLERLVVNLVDNAVRHNVPGGWVDVHTGTPGGWPTLCVINSGPVIRPDQVAELVQPFRRLDGQRRRREGHGLGLSIVAAITAAHGGRMTACPVPGGGLRVDVTLQPQGGPSSRLAWSCANTSRSSSV